MSTVKVYSENGVQNFNNLEEALSAAGFVQYDIEGTKYMSGTGDALTQKEHKELRITDAEKVTDAVVEKMEKVAEIYKNLNLIYYFEKDDKIPFYSRTSQMLAALNKKPDYYYDGKKFYFSKAVIEKFKNDRISRKEAVNKIMSGEHASINDLAISNIPDGKAYMEEARKANIIKTAYDMVMETDREVDKEQAQNMMDVYMSIFDDEKVLESVNVEVRQTPESEYYKEAVDKRFSPKDKVLITVPSGWVAERSKSGTNERFDVIKFPQDFKMGVIKGKYEFYFNIGQEEIKKEDGLNMYPFNYNDNIRLRKCTGKDPATNKWLYDIQYVDVKGLNKAVNEYLKGKEQEKEVEIEIDLETEQEDELMESYGFSLR